MPVTDVSAQLLDLIQAHWPLNPAPFAEFGVALSIAEGEVIERIRALQRERIIRQIGPIFDTKSLGYESSLVAMRVAPEQLDEAAAAVSAHPGVSHNYLREDDFNLWFTIAVPPDSRLGLEKTVDLIHELAGAESTRLLPTLRLFKIGVRFSMSGTDVADSQPGYSETSRAEELPPLTEQDMERVRITQRPLDVVARPFDRPAAEAGITADELLGWLERMKSNGRMRRFAAVLHHRKAGFTANGMGVWAVPPERVNEVGERMAEFPAVSHCYHRPAYEDWPYSIFTMVHGRSREDVEHILDDIAAECGVSDRRVLYSTTEYKKIRLQYFTPDLEEWEQEHAGGP